MRKQTANVQPVIVASRRASGRNAAPVAPAQPIVTGRASGRGLAPEANAA